MLKHFFDISTGFRYKKKLKRVLRPSIETSMARSTGVLLETSSKTEVVRFVNILAL